MQGQPAALASWSPNNYQTAASLAGEGSGAPARRYAPYHPCRSTSPRT